LPNTVNATAIANDALRYNGAGYQFGGSPATGIGHWDCSSFVSWVMGHDLKMSVPMYPNGTYTGNAHGATAAQYIVWTGATSIPRSSAAPGDLCCWLTHIGIVVGDNQMISAYDTAQGTLVTAIDSAGPAGEPLTIRRVNNAVGQISGATTTGASGCSIPSAMVVMGFALQHRIQRRRYIPRSKYSYRSSSR